MKKNSKKAIVCYLFGFLLCLNIISCGSESLTASGKVIDSTTTNPIEDASVTLTYGKSQTTTTGADGSFSVTSTFERSPSQFGDGPRAELDVSKNGYRSVYFEDINNNHHGLLIELEPTP